MYYFEKNNLKMNGLYITYNAGSAYEKSHHKGTMHLMEHLICKRLDNMQDEFTKRNIMYNAYTDEMQVVVYFTGLESQLNSDIKTNILKLLTDGVFVSENEFEKEKNIVIQEYYNHFNDLVYGSISNVLRKKYNVFNTIGDIDDIINFSYEEAKEVFNIYFKQPSNIIEVGRKKTDFSYIEYNDVPISNKRIKFGKYYNKEELLPITDTNSTIVITAKKCISKKDYPIMRILNDILSDGLNSPLYQELREKRGLIYCIFPFNIKSVNDTIFTYVVMTTKENVDNVIGLITDILTNLDKFITPQRFNDIINNNIISLEEKKIFRYEYPLSLNKNLPTLFKNKKQFKKITIDNIISVGKKYFNNIDINVF